MKVFNSLKEIKGLKTRTAVTIGVFDGMHLGHQRLIKKIVSCAKECGGKSMVLTFREHPDVVLKKGSGIQFIKNIKAKIARIEKCGVDMTALIGFNEVAGMTAEEFARDVLVKRLNACCVAAGRDFIFGRGGRGNTKILKEFGKKYGFKVIIPEDVKIKGARISSTRIRQYLKKGDIRTVEKMLGRPYAISGKVAKGGRIGFEFPTANIKLAYADIPARGVWAVRVIHKSGTYTGAANIGFAPTLKDMERVVLEVYILDFKKNIYGDDLRVEFIERLRDEKKFATHEELLEQVKKDVEYIRKKYLK
jgi:riboflavin kinase / FMN adenylyltransferase